MLAINYGFAHDNMLFLACAKLLIVALLRVERRETMVKGCSKPRNESFRALTAEPPYCTALQLYSSPPATE